MGRLKLLGFAALFFCAPAVMATEKSNCLRTLKKLFAGRLHAPWHQLIYLPGKTLASYPGVEIAGFLKNARSYGGAARHLARKMQAFDQYMLGLGFARPESSRFVFFNKKHLLPYSQDIYLIRNLIFNVWKGKLQTVTVVAPYSSEWNGPLSIMRDASALLHERTHDFMLRSYGRDAFVNLVPSIKEALADFLPVHQSGVPAIGIGLFEAKIPIRDIEKKVALGNKKAVISANRENFGKSYNKEYHNHSLHFSNFLWEMRQALGASVLSGLVKDFMDNLNFYSASFVQLLVKNQGINYQSRAVAELEYFLAVWKRTVVDAGDAEIALKVDSVIGRIADQMALDLGRIDTLVKNISKYDDGYRYDRAKEIQLGITFSAMNSAFMLVDGALLGGIVAAPFGLGYAFVLIYETFISQESN